MTEKLSLVLVLFEEDNFQLIDTQKCTDLNVHQFSRRILVAVGVDTDANKNSTSYGLTVSVAIMQLLVSEFHKQKF